MGIKITATQTVYGIHATVNKKVIHVDKNLPVQFAPANTANSEVLLATRNLTDDDLFVQFLNPSGSNRDVVLPDESYRNHAYIITNSGTTGNLVVKDYALTNIGIIEPGQSRFFISNGLQWVMLTTEENSVFTTKGDLLVATGAGAGGRLGAGSGGQILTPNSSEASGLKWVDDDQSFSVLLGNNVTAIPTGYQAWIRADKNIVIEQVSISARVASTITITVNHCTWANYDGDATSTVTTVVSGLALSAAKKVESSALSVAVAQGNMIGINVTSATAIEVTVHVRARSAVAS